VSLRWKIALALAVLAAGGSAAVGISTFRSTEDRLITEIDRSLATASERFLDLRDGSGGRGDRDGDGRPNRPLILVPERPLGVEQYVVQVTDASGEVLAATSGVTLPVPGPLATEDTARLETVASAEGPDYRVRTVEVEIGVVQMGRDLTETQNVLVDLRRTVWTIAIAVTAVAALIGWLLASGVTRRLRRLAEAAGEVAETGRLDVAAPSTGRDEAGRLGRTFADMLAALSRSRDQQRRLVEDAGHELRTPLTSLRTNLDVLRRHPEMDDELRSRVLADIDRDTADLAALVEEVVALAADRRTDELPEPLRLREVAASIVERAGRRSGREIVLVADDSVALVRRHMFERAVSNLVDNAIKFDGSAGRIDVSVHRGLVTVSDRGPGIPENEIPLVFDRFHRAVEARTLPGSGLGLSIVADVATTHGGTVFARNRTGGGAEVGFSLPVVG